MLKKKYGEIFAEILFELTKFQKVYILCYELFAVFC